MVSKLTLRVDSNSIAFAKRWAKAHGASLSQLVTEYFEHLRRNEDLSELGPWTKSIIGIVPGKSMTDAQVKQEWRRHLEEKHK